MREDSSTLPALTKHTVFQTVFFHLAPGLIQLLIMVLLIPISLRLGFAGMEGQFAGNMVDVFTLMPLPVYYWVMKRKNMRFSLVAHMIANIYTGVSLLLRVI